VKSNFLFSVFAASVIFLSASAPADAALYSFYNITNTIAENVEIGISQLSVEVTDPGSDQILFTFRNIGDDACSISEVYFDDGSLLGIAELIDEGHAGGDSGVDFEPGANPSNLPSGNNAVPLFEATANFSSQASNPAPDWGVNPGEYLGILFNINSEQSEQTFDNVITELNSGALRIGLHVTAFELGESESFINTVPIPATAWMFGAGLVGLIGIRRKLVSPRNPG